METKEINEEMDYFGLYPHKEVLKQSKRSSVRAYINPLHAVLNNENLKEDHVSKESNFQSAPKQKESRSESRISSSSNADSIYSNYSVFGKLYLSFWSHNDMLI